jgi:signal transduction histidine kinase
VAVVSLALPLLAASPRRGLEGYSRRVWHAQDGLPEETVQAFAQTPDRYLWIGTTGGLVRFDGAHWVVFDRENTPAFRENSVFWLMAAKDGGLWIATDGGGLVRYRNGVFRSYSDKEGLTNEFVRTVYQDHSGTVWVGTDDGLFRVVGDALTRVDGRSGVPAIAVHAIYEDSQGRLWVGGSSLLMLNGNRAAEYRFQGGFSANRIKSILETRDGTLWVGTVSGLQRMERHGAGFARVPEISSTVRVLREDRDGTLWIGTIGEGIFRFREGRFSKLTAPDSLPSDTVLSIFEDTERNVWVGTQTGLLRLSKTAVSTFPLPDAADSDFSTVYQDRDGALWVASTRLFRFVGDGAVPHQFPGPLAGIRIRNLFRDSAGVLWVGTDGHGAFRLSGPQPVQYTKKQGLINDFIRVFCEGRDGSIWIGTDEGMSRWRPEGITNYGVRDGLSYFSIRALLEDRRGDLWIGTEKGVSRFHAGAFVRDAVVERLRSEKVWAIHEDPEGGLWFGTRGGGLFRWKLGKLTLYTSAQGLASNSIYHILEDHSGTFWMSGPNGISSVSRRDLDRMSEVPSHRPAVTLYGISEGMETTQMHGGTQPAGSLTARGEVWFPSNKGPVRIRPDWARGGDLPSAVIERVVADGRQVQPSGQLVLPPGDGKLEIYYSAIRLRSQERVRFRYKLEGFDPDWTEAFGRRAAYYTNLPPGEYRFRVAAFEMSEPQSVSETTVRIDWQPHFYRTAWFFTLCLALLLAAAWGAYRFHLRQIHARFEGVLEERSRVAREMHDTLIQGCGAVSALLEASSTLGDSAPEMRQELLDCARAQVRTTIDEARRAVWNLRQKPATGDGIGSTLSQIAQQVSLESRIPILCETDGKPSALDQEVERELLMVAREALHNAVQHARPRNVQLRLCFDRRKVRLRVVDDGCGFELAGANSPSSDHYGLVCMRERIERLGGRFILQSKPGEGTQIEVAIPLRKAAEAASGAGA